MMKPFVLLAMLATVTLAGCAQDAAVPVDSDGDGFPDDEEARSGSDPHDAASTPAAPAPETAPDVPPAWGDVASAAIRPGASLGGYCTFNFLYYGLNGSAYIGTAGHCTDEVGERVSLGSGDEIGAVVYDSDLIDHGSDFSLILLDAEQVGNAHPQMLSWDGPTGFVTSSDLAEGDIIQLHGYGVVLGDNDVTRARQGTLVSWTEEEYDVDMPAVNGDSGSPLLHQSGAAFGIVSRYGFTEGTPSTDTGPLMPYVFDGLAQTGYGDVQLATI